MQLFELTLTDLINKLNNNEVSSAEVVASFVKRIQSVDDQVKAFITIDEDVAAGSLPSSFPRGILQGIPYGLKDDICTKGMRTTCASKMLENFTPHYDATVAKLLKEQGGILIGKLNMDEFAFGSSTETSAFFPTRNPWDLSRVPGGSSGGSAAAVAAGEIPFALGLDTGGSIRQPAAFCGIVGFKPTYGRVSRWGVATGAPSLSQVGVLSKTVADAALVMNIIAGKDPLDSTSVDMAVPDYTTFLDIDIRGMKIGLPRELFINIDAETKTLINQALKKYEELGAIIEEVSLPHSEYGLPAYYVIAPAQASTTLARFDGVEFGFRDIEADNVAEMFANTRAKGFGTEVKTRILLGTYVLSAAQYEKYYLKALKVRRLIHDDFVKVFRDFDCIITPTTANTAFKLGESAESLTNDYLTVPANLAGLPAMSIPCGFINNLPLGMQIIGKPFAEGDIIKLANAFEQSTDYHRQKPDLGVN